MDGLENYKSKLNALQELVKKMESGVLSIPELSELETLTRELHERSIILKYKAFESKVNAEKSALPAKEEAPIIPIAEPEKPKEEPIVEAEEAASLDFSLFDQESTEEISEEVVETPIEVPRPEVKVEEAPKVEEKVMTPPKVEENIVHAPKVEDKPIEPPKEVAVEESPSAGSSSLLERLKLPDNLVSSQFSGGKIESLSGAFGLNERLRFIKELFDNSGDSFRAAIDILDAQSSIGIASEKVEELAFQNSWDLEEEIVLEFMAVIKRRYA
jgi:hypothetical protein